MKKAVREVICSLPLTHLLFLFMIRKQVGWKYVLVVLHTSGVGLVHYWHPPPLSLSLSVLVCGGGLHTKWMNERERKRDCLG